MILTNLIPELTDQLFQTTDLWVLFLFYMLKFGIQTILNRLLQSDSTLQLRNFSLKIILKISILTFNKL